MHSPLEQFNIYNIGHGIKIGNIDLSFTNSAVMLSIVAILIAMFGYISLRNTNLIPNKMQMAIEMVYDFAYNMSVDNMGELGKRMVPFILTLFLVFLFGNLLGLIPFAFSVTSHIAITFSMAFVVLLIGLTYGLYKHKLRFFLLFVPKDIPFYLLIFVVPLEVISFFSKIFSMAVRLFANIMSGHLMLFVIASFVFSLGFFGILPFSFLVILTGFEIFIAVLHAYIFTVLTCIFIGEVANLH